MVLPIAIYGVSYETIGHTDQGPFDLITILRPVPADGSHSDWEKQDVITREVNWSISKGKESSTSDENKAELGASYGPVSVKGSISEKKERTYSNTNSEGNSHTVSYSVTDGYSNYTKSDRFIARQLEVGFIAENRLNLIASPGSPNV